MSTVSQICGVAIAGINKIVTASKSSISSIYGITVQSGEMGVYDLYTPDDYGVQTPTGDQVSVQVDVIILTVADATNTLTSDGDVWLTGAVTLLDTPEGEDLLTPTSDYVAIVE